MVVHVTSPFPFDAVVGHADAKLALRLAAIEPLLGGVLLRGEKGSAKTTLARGLAALLGDAPFVELPLGASEDRLVGSLDTRAALSGGEIRFHPGLLADADGGVLYVDEINLLPDHLVDVLLDVAVSGENRVERDGLSHRHRARFVLVGSMNPEEGELRPQLLDRFGLCVMVTSSTDLTERVEAVRRRLSFDRGQMPTLTGGDERPLRDVVAASIGDDVVDAASRLAVSVGAEGLRADLALCRAAAARAGWEQRASADIDDVAAVAPLVLAHRSRRGPFDPPVLPPEALDDAIEQALGDTSPDGGGADDGMTDDGDVAGDRSNSGGESTGGGVTERPLAMGAMRRPVDAARPRAVPSARGRAVGEVAAGADDPIAIVPTARRIAEAGGDRQAADVMRRAVTVAVPQRTVVLCVDLSGSMGATERAEAATGTVLGLLTGVYERRDKVGLVTFRADGAEVVLTPTGSVEVARHRLGALVTGGTTSLAEGLSAALEVARKAGPIGSDVQLAILTDGRATGSPDAFDRALHVAARIKTAGIAATVLDCETGATRLGLAAQLAEAMGARLVHVDSLTPATVAAALSIS